MSEREKAVRVRPRRAYGDAIKVSLAMDVNKLADWLDGHQHWQILLDPTKGAAVLVNGFRAVTGDWLVRDEADGMVSRVKAEDFEEQWEQVGQGWQSIGQVKLVATSIDPASVWAAGRPPLCPCGHAPVSHSSNSPQGCWANGRDTPDTCSCRRTPQAAADAAKAAGAKG